MFWFFLNLAELMFSLNCHKKKMIDTNTYYLHFASAFRVSSFLPFRSTVTLYIVHIIYLRDICSHIYHNLLLFFVYVYIKQTVCGYSRTGTATSVCLKTTPLANILAELPYYPSCNGLVLFPYL